MATTKSVTKIITQVDLRNLNNRESSHNTYPAQVDQKKNRRNQTSTNVNRSVIVGKNENCDLVAGEKKAWFYLGRLKSDTTADAGK